MTIALYLIAYMLMYAAAIKLRYSAPERRSNWVAPTDPSVLAAAAK
jgi:amino acid transporter